MSFASETKKELTNLEMKECCEKAELSALLRMNGSLFSNRRLSIDIQTENAAIARRIYTLLKKGYDVTVELLVRKNAIEENNVYIVRLVEKSREILADLHIVRDDFSFIRNISQELIEKKCCKRSYLRGAF